MTDTEIDTVRTAIDSQDPAEGLRAVVVLRRLAERLEAQHVVAARRSGWTWEDIGDALGVSRQAVHKKYRKAT
ncbi:MAG TPA: helix-turn-helix transcriptional regulator [Acidimicrobiia bacterium]|nr:helix-turn-helix transcriptional regulator [Acidimicrobiia bacterium]